MPDAERPVLPAEAEIAALCEPLRADGAGDGARQHVYALLRQMVAERPERALLGALGRIASLRASVEADARWGDEILGQIAEKREPLDAEIAFLEAAIIEAAKELPRPGTKYVDVPGLARIQYRDDGDDVRIADPEAFIAWARAHERADLYERATVYRLQTAEAKKVARAHLADGGEVLPGVEKIPGERRGTIRWPKPRRVPDANSD